MRILKDINPQYAIGMATRRNIAYAALPADLRKTLDSEFAKSNQLEWPQLRTFLITFSDADASGKDVSTTPISLAPILDQQPQPRQYTQDEWMAHAITEEGQQFFADNQDMPEVKETM